MRPTFPIAASLAAVLLLPVGAGAEDRIECAVEARLHRVAGGPGPVAYPREPGQAPLPRGLAEVEITVLAATPKTAHRDIDRERCAGLVGRRETLKVRWENPERKVPFDLEAPLRLDYTWIDIRVAAPFETWDLPPEPGTWVPPFLDEVTDLAKVLAADQLRQLRQELGAASDARVWVLTVPSLSGEAIEAFSLRVANQWSKDQGGNGWEVLVTLALAERTARIEVGKELVETIPDARAQQIIDEEMVPAFRQGDYATGLARGLRALLEAANPGSSFVECVVKAKVLKLEKHSAVTKEIAVTLDLPEETVGVLGVAMVEIDVLDARPRRGKKESCDAMVGKTGKVVVRYELSRRDKGFAAGEVLDLDYFGFAGFPPYGVPGREAWTLR